MNKKIENSVIYNVYPSSFYDSNGDGIGDLPGITQKLEYIKQFADIVWINSFFKSPFRDGGYDIEDYYAVNEQFGTMEDLKELIDKAHSLGLKILICLVVGHTSDAHKWYLESQKAEKNEYSDYYIWTDQVFDSCPYKIVTGTSERNGNCLVNFFTFQPALNYGFAKKTFEWQNLYTDEVCKKVHNEVKKIIRYYLELGVDGFRVDLASGIVKDDENGKCSCEVWNEIFAEARRDYPDAIFLSEWGQPQYAVASGAFDVDFLNHCYFDGYNRLFRKEAGTNVFKSDGNSFFRKEGKGECKAFFEYVEYALKESKDKGYISIITGNHDLPRIGMGRTQDEMKTVFAFILAMPGIPIIYYGDEIGMPYTNLKNKDGGYNRTGARTPMQWTAGKNAGFSTTDGELYLPINENYTEVNCESMEKDENSLINTVKSLLDIKRRFFGGLENGLEVINDDYPMVFSRKKDGATFLCAVNPSDREYEIEVPEGGRILSSLNAQVSGNKAKLGGVSYLWIYSEK
ncbi:MAG: glycosylase [Lachnospiraceae bacterium]|nr:glycosylase [Lachnospiraceae bacterium]